MERPASSVRRRAWINSSRPWLTVEDAETQTFTSVADDDVFSDGQVHSPGNCSGKIENWLDTCGSLEVSLEKAGQLSFDSELKAKNCDDELSLGADAIVVNKDNTREANFELCSATRERRNRLTSSKARPELSLPSQSLGHSMGSSCYSSSTWNSTASVSDVLQVYSEDAEETLYELGFGREEPQVTVRIPPRFFTFPSQAKGINFRLFLDAQLQRIHEEDPGLSLASRFRQVQVLTAMANAFYSLYSHVSRTPVQKLPTPEFNFSTPIERIERFRSSLRSDPRSPVDKLKDTVSKMCLYTGSPRESDSVSPQPSPMKSLPDVVEIVLENSKHIRKLNLGEVHVDTSNDVCLEYLKNFNSDQIEHHGDAEEIENLNGNTNEEFVYSEGNICQTVELEELDTRTHTVRTSPSLPKNEVTEMECFSCKPESSQWTADTKPFAKISYDLICPQIVESVHQAPFHSQDGEKTNSTFDDADITDISCYKSHIAMSSSDQNSPTIFFSSGAKKQNEAQTVPLLTNDVSSVTLTMTCKKITIPEKHHYLSPVQHIFSNLQQVNSFELEEVHSAGEEDLGQSAKSTKFAGEIVRGDSMQSDSSGYADEDTSSDRHS